MLTCVQPLPSTRTSTRRHSRGGGGSGSGDNSPPVIGSSCRTPTKKERCIRTYPCSISPIHKPRTHKSQTPPPQTPNSKQTHPVPSQNKSQLPPPPLGQIPHHLLTPSPLPQLLLLRRHKLPSLQTPPHKKHIPHPAQHIPPPFAPQHDAPAREPLQRAPHVGHSVRPRRVRLDAGPRQRAVRVERAEERGRAGQVVDGLDPRRVVGWAVAVRGEGVDAGGVAVVLGLPEGGVGVAVGVRTAVRDVGCCWGEGAGLGVR